MSAIFVSGDTPRTDKMGRRIGKVLAQYAAREVKLMMAGQMIDNELNVSRQMEHELLAPFERDIEIDGSCSICSYPLDAATAKELRVRVCTCLGIQPYTLSKYPGQYEMVRSHPTNKDDVQYYSREEIDPLVRGLQKQLSAARKEIEQLTKKQ